MDITEIGLGIMLEDITGYYVTIKYHDGMVFESHCGVGKGCFSVHDEPYEATPEEWEGIIEWNRNYIEKMKAKYPGSKFRFWAD